MKNTVLATLLAASVAVPAFPQSTPPPAQSTPIPTETVTLETEAITVPDDAPRGSSGPAAVGAGIGIGAVVLVFGVMALGAVFAMGGS